MKTVHVTDFVRGGTSRYVCTLTHGKCPRNAMASIDGRECAAESIPCDWKRKRYSPEFDVQCFPANATAEGSGALATDTLRRDVGPCQICGDPGCLGNECEPEPEEEDDDLCDQCGQPSGCLLNGLCPMCYETGGGVFHRRSNQ
jgi:hypothetical protein